ncbi:uncharacterized protein FSUBG_4143 [Fusarium subglutinans]|uniref:gamma-glutamylcyclotransferase n=1 Tax=Gibberella subglutinans TaxID=42677 RepID=A0A8H5V5D1_GIBSU|nr:uncharacterized protein FSUBG_4143 [Fusarium subglutinans]KAF5609350.1 hypothetical protein FSUBG_4143 [Fusarium subglutinans]
MYAFNPSGPTYEQSATVDAPGSRMIRAASTLYFAYGSNLHLAQMAHRCPGSVFKGKATLESYRWQINERGVANVVESGSDHSVEGLLYMIGPKDERTLDRSEGVSKGFYQKYLMRVSFEPHQQYANFKTGRLSHLLEQRRDSMSGDGTHFPSNSNRKVRFNAPPYIDPLSYMDSDDSSGRHARTEQVKTLVYVSEDYVTDGSIREEYIARMQNAVNDAVSLGISKSFVNKYIVPFLDSEQIWHLSEGKSTENRCEQPSKLLDLESEPEAQAIVNEGSTKEQLSPNPPAENNMADISESATDEKSSDVDMNEETNQEEPSSQPVAKEDDLSAHLDLSKLRTENRDEDGDSSMFPTDLLEAVDKVNCSAIDGSGKNIYLIIVYQKGAEANSGFSVATASKGIQVANELAMKEFRHLYALHTKPVVEEEEPDVVVVKEGSPGDLTWKLGDDAYLHLSSARPGEEPWLMLWVEPKQLMECR